MQSEDQGKRTELVQRNLRKQGVAFYVGIGELIGVNIAVEQSERALEVQGPSIARGNRLRCSLAECTKSLTQSNNAGASNAAV
jgi:hypothetical protein